MNIIKIKYLGEYQYQVWFANGQIKIIDLKSFLSKSKHPLINKFIDKKLFGKAYIDHGDICWGDNEFDLDPQDILNDEFAPKRNKTINLTSRKILNLKP
jgi:hypothetical protein